MFKEFLLRKLVQSKLNAVPKAEQEKILKIIEKDPELMLKIAKEVESKMKEGMSQGDAALYVMRAHESELKHLLGN